MSGALAPTALKVVDFEGGEIDGAGSSPRARLFRRLLLQALLSCPNEKRKGVCRVPDPGAEGARPRRRRGRHARRAGARVADEAFVTHGLSFAKEDAEKRDSAASVREAAGRRGGYSGRARVRSAARTAPYV